MLRKMLISLVSVLLGFLVATICDCGRVLLIGDLFPWIFGFLPFVFGGYVAGLIAQRSEVMHGLCVGLLPVALPVVGTIPGFIQMTGIPWGVIIPSVGGGIIGGWIKFKQRTRKQIQDDKRGQG